MNSLVGFYQILFLLNYRIGLGVKFIIVSYEGYGFYLDQ